MTSPETVGEVTEISPSKLGSTSRSPEIGLPSISTAGSFGLPKQDPKPPLAFIFGLSMLSFGCLISTAASILELSVFMSVLFFDTLNSSSFTFGVFIDSSFLLSYLVLSLSGVPE